MSKTARIVAFVALLLTVLTLNISLAGDEFVIEEGGCCPCYDKYQNCIGNGGTEAACDRVWCQCMRDTYGTTNC